jgi:predicted dehydrogenase
MTWRLSTKHGSAGVLGDIGCHIYDLTALLCGDIAEIGCTLRTFDKGIKGNRIGPYALDANDSFVSTVTFAEGGLGTVHATRWATGQINSLRVRVYGDEGAVEIDLDKSNDLYRICKGKPAARKGAWKDVHCRRVPTQYERFIQAVRSGKSDVSDFANGAKVQAYLDASVVSDREKKSIKVKF